MQNYRFTLVVEDRAEEKQIEKKKDARAFESYSKEKNTKIVRAESKLYFKRTEITKMLS